MKKSIPKNLAASVRQRLFNLARARREDFQLVLGRFAMERLLYRLSQSAHRDQFLLKGALLFQLWAKEHYRPTRDLDLLGTGENSIERFETMFDEISVQPVEDDGLRFLSESLHAERIKEDQESEGLRVQMEARLERARIPLQIDIGFGDAVFPGPEQILFPTILDFPAPMVAAYTKESVVAEKYQAVVVLGMTNSRMKDFYDLWICATRFDFLGERLCRAIRATFERRRTNIPAAVPIAFSKEFHEDKTKKTQWRNFIAKNRLNAPEAGLEEVLTVLGEFLMPPTNAIRGGNAIKKHWSPPGPWKD